MAFIALNWAISNVPLSDGDNQKGFPDVGCPAQTKMWPQYLSPCERSVKQQFLPLFLDLEKHTFC